jgi:hypothetical protein
MIECFRLDLLSNLQQVKDGTDAILDHSGTTHGIYASTKYYVKTTCDSQQI